jgi:hypothetical protein
VSHPLTDKYRRMLELRARLTGPLDARDRATLKQLAREYPGALRELDSLPTDEIERRLAACERGGEPWLDWMQRYHTLMRAALRIKSGGAAVDVDDAFARAVRRPEHGRVMAVVFTRLASELGLPRQQVWDTLFPPRKGPRGYRQG